MLSLLWRSFQGILVLGTFVVSAVHYGQFGAEVPEYFKMVLMLGVFGVSAAGALVHLVGGSIFGVAAGGFWEGVRGGCVLGIGFAVGRLWVYSMMWGLGALAFGILLSETRNIFIGGGFVVLGIALFGLNIMMKSIWENVGTFR